ADMVGAYRAERDESQLRAIAGYHVPSDLVQDFIGVPFQVADHAFVQEAFATRQPVHSTNVIADSRIDRRSLTRIPRSVLFVPMFDEVGPLGGIFAVWWDEARSVTPEELVLAEGIARQAAIAVMNATLYAEADQRRRTAEALVSVARALTGSL